MQHGWCISSYRALALSAVLFPMMSLPALAGPPFATDDPDPTPYRSYEIYIASDYARTPSSVDGTVPHLEVNYGLFRNVQFTVTLPFAGTQEPHGLSHFGYGDTEFEVKFQIMRETDTLPQISLAPTVVLPSGKAALGLGGGFGKTFFPLWAEKGFGRYTVYGGGGLWRNPGAGNQNYTFSGIAVERDMGHGLTLGSEVFRQSADTLDGHASVDFSLGTVKDLDERHKMLFSLGRSVHGPCSFSGYAAYELFFGPREKPDPSTDAAPDPSP